MISLKSKDLELAWQRVKQDRPDRCFVTHHLLFDLIELDVSTWLQIISEEIARGYTPQGCLTCYCPKPGWMVRPGAVLDIKDEIVFNALLGISHKQFWEAMDWSQGAPDVAYQFRENPHRSDWIRSGYEVFREWRAKSLQKLAEGTQYVLFADIAGFYENVDLDRLNSDLGGIGLEESTLKLITQCLRRWAQPRGKGIPQGYSGSDLLAKLYMAPVDMGMRNAGYRHLRYVDDFRIFCSTELEAKKALLKLTDLLRSRGLNLQSTKTLILPTEDARTKIDGVAPVLNGIKAKLLDEMKEIYDLSNPYATIGEIDEILESHAEEPAPTVLEVAFAEYFTSRHSGGFDKTLFHFLLNRLAKAKSRAAVRYCLDLLPVRPEETSYVLKYLGELELTDNEMLTVAEYAASDEAIYDYQLYEIARWFHYREHVPQLFIKLCRDWVFDKNRSPWLRSYAIAILGRIGDKSDLENIQSHYEVVTTGIEKADVITALERMEITRRNAFYGRVQNDSELSRRAVMYVRRRS